MKVQNLLKTKKKVYFSELIKVIHISSPYRSHRPIGILSNGFINNFHSHNLMSSFENMYLKKLALKLFE